MLDLDKPKDINNLHGTTGVDASNNKPYNIGKDNTEEEEDK